ncbi:hypothetical protein BJY00DRAFT_326244 [Aspergillus carlsbadensis]|nr:hypothetical protein BJY00DRAFT_326244 [Aspergillus carlsbadensis]
MSADATVSHEANGLHPQIQFPDMKSTMGLLVDFLFSDRETQVKFNRGTSQTVIAAIGGPEASIDVMYETINPEIKTLEGKIINPRDRPPWGYLDFVTHAYEHTYLSFYVGQSKQPENRLPEHTKEIRKGSTGSLHYYILKNGEGLRIANFIWLWAIPFPPRTNNMIKVIVKNFLEKETFGPCPQGQYSGIGLNLVSPLIQGIPLDPQTRRQIAERLRESPDPEICQWPDIRKNRPMNWNSGSDGLPSRQYMDNQSYYDAIHRAIGSSLSLEESTSIQDETASPVGTSEACIGVVFETTPLQGYNENGKLISVPWGLRESGLHETNSLIWPFDLRKYDHIPGTFNRLKVVIMCGNIQGTIVPRHAKAITLILNDITYDS